MAFLGLMTACSNQDDPNTVKVGVMSGPEEQLMEVAQAVAKQNYGLNIQIVSFSNYNMPNAALSDGSIDANMFQHLPFLQAQMANQGYKLVSIGETFVYPMGLYSRQITELGQLQEGAVVAIPNDPTNEARALGLLQSAGLITLKPDAGVSATTQDIISNPKNLEIAEMDAAQLPRALNDTALAAINSNYAIAAGLSAVNDALFSEGDDSEYANLIVVRQGEENDLQLNELVLALHSPEVLQKAKELFGDDAIPAWPVANNSNNSVMQSSTEQTAKIQLQEEMPS